MLSSSQSVSAEDSAWHAMLVRTPVLKLHKRQAVEKIKNNSGTPGTQLCMGLFSNSCHWSLKVSTCHHRHPATQGGSRGAREVQLTGPRSTEGVTDDQHEERARKKGGGGGESEIQGRGGDEGEVCKKREGEGKVVITQMGRYAPSIHPMLL